MNQTSFIILSGTILFVNIVFIALAFGINKNNAKYLLAGYNTMSKDDSQKFDIDGFLIFFKKFFLQISIYSTLIFILLFILFDPVVSIIGYTMSIILPMPLMIHMGNKFYSK
jgi:hypothetical protein